MGEIQNEWLQELYKVSLGRLGLTLIIPRFDTLLFPLACGCVTYFFLTVCGQCDGVDLKEKKSHYNGDIPTYT